MSTRYFVFSKNSYSASGVAKSMKNAATREDAREYKRMSSNPEKLGIWDRQSNQAIR